MKNFNILFLLLAITFFNCATEEKRPPMTPEEEVKAWSTFQENFQEAVKKNAINDVVKLTKFPLKGNLNIGNSDGVSESSFIKNYVNIFGGGIRNRVAKTKVSEWQEAKVENAKSAELLGVPHNSKVVTLTINSIVNKGKENQTESSHKFYFGKINEEFKMIGLFITGLE